MKKSTLIILLAVVIILFIAPLGTVNNFGDECLGSLSAPSIWF